jgi:ATP-dependent Clp protease protease subunit
MSRAKTELESFLVYGVDEKNRRVYFGTDLVTSDPQDFSGFTPASCEFAIRAIERMATDHPKTPIEIHMNSYGGDPYAMLALYDVMHTVSCQIKFFGKGAIMSAATWIMCAADERNLYPNTTIMVHDGWDGYYGKFTDYNISNEESNRLMDLLYDIYEKNSRMPRNFWEEVCKRDLYLTAEEAVQLGLADKIVHPKKRGNLRKTREYHLKQKIDKRRMNRLVDKLMKRVKINTKLEIKLPEHKPEPVDERLTIEPLKDNESSKIDKKMVETVVKETIAANEALKDAKDDRDSGMDK